MKKPHEMSGLEIMQAFKQGLVPQPGIAKTMGMEGVGDVEFGRIVFTATADERHSNPLGGVHGGFAATVLDSVTGCATHTVLAAGEGYGTTDLAIKMCRPMPFNKKLIAEGKVINVGKNLVISEGYLRDEDGKLYAHATATNMIIRR
ncbi:PaaI family thioesterase (plasmid) [Acinetobacter corruptisaponis]|uniref:PaaI family thioesterase n=1 Tax=Acinetobacter corruptisaponis TaxID=3045147 RepID=A0ABY8S8E4_9GAMM|nr:PaaI family thioesterase [Acinetobacter sp. KCTC 92772]WHP07726.1 PaaI family thioesterase [Acinetobacter sp. KCTC 92772]